MRGRRRWDKWRQYHGNTYTTIYKTGSQWGFAVLLRVLKQVLRNNLEGCDVVGGGRARMEGTYVNLWLIHIDVWQKPTQYCKTTVFRLKIIFFKKWRQRERCEVFSLPACMCAQWPQSCLTLCDPMDCNPPGPSVHGILQARILEWVAISFSRGFYQPRDRTVSAASPALQQIVYPLSHLKSPFSLPILSLKTSLISNHHIIHSKW